MQDLSELLGQALKEFEGLKSQSVNDSASLREARNRLSGKDGLIKQLFGLLRDVPAEEKAEWASKINGLREEVEAFLEEANQGIERKKLDAQLSSEAFDLTLPGISPGLGRVHPLIQVELEITELMACFGFVEADGPEIEDEYFCFDSLNIPPLHPARDMQDTFYTDTGHVLRTHTTSVQSRALKSSKPPIKIVAPGRVYRNETIDASHTDMFHQYEGLWVEKGLTLAHLTELLTQVLKELYGRRRKVRFVQKYYPYTEPSVGILVSSLDGDGWTTVGGAGIVHQKVLEEFDLDPTKISGLAFGLGTTRLVAERYGFPNLRAIYQNDLRVYARMK